MRELFEKKVNIILIVVILIVAILIGIPMVSRGCYTSTSNGEIVTKPATADEAESTTEETTVKPTPGDDIKDTKVKIKKKNAGNSSTASASTKSDPRKSTSSKAKKKKKSSSSKVYATAPKVENKASHTAQWNAGYLVAIDNPDTSYSCEHVELSDKDRDLLEKLCMGELGSGGFTGAALIAQAVKNAMYFEGYTNVQDVISNLHYTGRLTTPTKSVKDAVIYVFDMDKNAIQHRILYMYNPELMKDNYSSFHESQRYICTYQDVRFFDK